MRRYSLLAVSFGLVLSAALPALASPVATDDATYLLYGRVFPDPHGCVKGEPGTSPYAQGTVCATEFIQFEELQAGLAYLEGLFPQFIDVMEIPGESAGLPTNTLERQKSPLYAVRVTDESVTDAKGRFAFSLSIHGIERAGAEGGTRAIEDLATWAANDPNRPLLETVPDSAVTVGQTLANTEIWFFYPNPDGWQRGDIMDGGLMYQRYNGNGVDLNRDWPTKGYTFVPYTPQSEPESKGVADFFLGMGPGWEGSADLHGMLHAIAFTYTMLPAGEHDYARNQEVVATARRIQEDAWPRLSWFPTIRPYDERPTLTRPHAQQWGTVWDTIAYTTTGSLGDWMGSELGLNARVPMNNEMWVSHLVPNNLFDPNIEQAHIDGNKGLIYSQIESAFRAAQASFPATGRIAYVDHGHVFEDKGTKEKKNRYADLSPQVDLATELTSPTLDGVDPTFEFEVFGPEDDLYNGGLTVEVTFTNVDGLSAGATAAVYVERLGDEHGGAREWEVVNYDYNQSPIYLQAGMTVNVNSPEPALYRVRLQNAPAGVHVVEVKFTSEQSWPDPGQLAYKVSSLDFFDDLNPYLTRRTTKLSPDEILGGEDLSGIDTLILVNDPFPGYYDPKPSGGPQPGESFTMIAPAIQFSEEFYEFDVLPQYNNVAMTIAVTWEILSDYDLLLDRQTSSGEWVQIAAAENFLNLGETIEISGMFPGHYRARVYNWAGVAQNIEGKITFAETGITPPEYPVTRTAEERDAYYARLDAFVRDGGNLVLADGAARALPHLGVGAPDDVKPQLVYAPYIAFTADGSSDTYADPLATNVDQPGAAEGPSHRRQTVEPVPLGYAIQDGNGANQAHSFAWAVRREAFVAAEGRIVGTVGNDVVFGEISRGAGVIRFVGALLPDPEVRYDHPYGIVSYALTYTGWQVFENVVQWQRP